MRSQREIALQVKGILELGEEVKGKHIQRKPTATVEEITEIIRHVDHIRENEAKSLAEFRKTIEEEVKAEIKAKTTDEFDVITQALNTNSVLTGSLAPESIWGGREKDEVRDEKTKY